jgi:hypothetical protein
MTEIVTEVEWAKITIQAFPVRANGRRAPGTGPALDFYKAWKAGHPALVGYGTTLNEAITVMLNKFGE